MMCVARTKNWYILKKVLKAVGGDEVVIDSMIIEYSYFVLQNSENNADSFD
jgi:hypothetical protein